MEISCKCCTRGSGEAGSKCRGSLVVRTGCFCRSHFGRKSGRVQRAQAHTSRDSHFGRSRRRHAVACEREATTVRSYRQCDVEGGRRAVGAVCLPLAHRLGGIGDQRYLARKVGRPHFGLAVLPLIVWEGWEAMRGKGCGCC